MWHGREDVGKTAGSGIWLRQGPDREPGENVNQENHNDLSHAGRLTRIATDGKTPFAPNTSVSILPILRWGDFRPIWHAIGKLVGDFGAG
jgi:hypothetical protein